MRMLLVDSSTTIQKIFKIALGKVDVEIECANTWLEATQILNRSGFDLLVFDASLRQGGSDLSKIKALAKSTPVVLLASAHDEIDAGELASAGFPHLLRKPFDAQDIVRTLSQITGHSLEPKSVPVMSLELNQDFVPPPPPKMKIPLPQDLPSELMTPPPPSDAFMGIPLEPSRAGKKAFQDPPTHSGFGFVQASDEMAETMVLKPAFADGRPFAEAKSFADPQSDISSKLEVEKFLREDAPLIVRKAVEAFCEQHFSGLARDILTAELRRLAEEKLRILG